MKKEALKKALRDTLPVLTGYLVLGMGFGIVMHAAGFPWWLSVLMSLCVYAGSMQYAAVGLLTGGTSLLTVALTTLAVNARHLFYGLSMTEAYRGTGKRKPYLIFGLTDETYALVSGENKDADYCFFVTLFDHIYWVGGTLLGALAGQLIPFSVKGIEFALTALFVTVFVAQWKENKRHWPALAGLGLSAACLAVFGPERFLIPAMIAIFAGLMLGRGLEKK